MKTRILAAVTATTLAMAGLAAPAAAHGSNLGDVLLGAAVVGLVADAASNGNAHVVVSTGGPRVRYVYPGRPVVRFRPYGPTRVCTVRKWRKNRWVTVTRRRCW